MRCAGKYSKESATIVSPQLIDSVPTNRYHISMWLLLAFSVIPLSFIAVGTVVLLRGGRSQVNSSFALFAYSVAAWIFFNFIGANYKSYDFSLYASKLDFVLGGFLVYTVWNFSAALLKAADIKKRFSKHYSRLARLSALVLALCASLVSLVPAVVKETKQPNQDLELHYGSLFLLFTIPLLLILIGVGINFFITIRSAKGRLRQQVTFMLVAFGVGVLFVGFANLILPQISNSTATNQIAGNVSYFGIAVLVMTIFYSIIRHRLFDLRLILVRSLAYFLLVGVLVIGYISITLVLSGILIENYQTSSEQMLVPIISITILVFTIGPLGRFLNRATRNLFYKDSYESQQFLGELNNVVISNAETATLLRNVSQVIDQYLKSYFSTFDLRGRRLLVGSSVSARFNATKLAALRNALQKNDQDLVVLDELTSDHEELRVALDNLNVALAVRLKTPHNEKLGFLLMGQKRNGGSYTTQDLEVISIAMGELVIAIQNAFRFEEINRFNTTLQEKVEEATRQLRHSNQRLRLLDQTKDDFISMASHQLRTPLTSVKGYISMVLDGDAGKLSPLQHKLLNQSFISSQRMVYLISDLLNVSRLRTGKFVIEATETNLADVIESEIEQLRETARGKSLTLSYEKPEHFPRLMLDENKLRQVIMNFIDNALYYTPSGGHVTVHLVDRPQSIEFTVVDNGIGVPRHERHHLFGKFYRASNAKRIRPDGTGLGLFMAKKVVIAQGGAVIFKSQEDKGSTFGFTFPKRKLTVKQEKSSSED